MRSSRVVVVVLKQKGQEGRPVLEMGEGSQFALPPLEPQSTPGPFRSQRLRPQQLDQRGRVIIHFFILDSLLLGRGSAGFGDAWPF